MNSRLLVDAHVNLQAPPGRAAKVGQSNLGLTRCQRVSPRSLGLRRSGVT